MRENFNIEMRDVMIKRKGKACLRGRFTAMLMTIVLIFTVMPFEAKAETEMVSFGLIIIGSTSHLIDTYVDSFYIKDLTTNERRDFERTSENTIVVNNLTKGGQIELYISGIKQNTFTLDNSMEWAVTVAVINFWDGATCLNTIYGTNMMNYLQQEYVAEPEKDGHIFMGWINQYGEELTFPVRMVEERKSNTGILLKGEVNNVQAVWVSHIHDWDTVNWNNDEDAHWHECLVDDCPITDNTRKDGYADHEFSDWTIVSEAKFREDGLKKRNCNICGYEEEEIIPKLSDSHVHEFEGTEEIIRDPKCYELGLKKVYCTLDECGEYEEREIEKISHDYEEDYRYSDVIHYHKCKNCEDCIDEDYHEMTDWNVVNEATFSEDGLKERHCTECEYEENEILKKLSATHEHDYTGREEIVSDSTCTKEGVKKIYCYEEQCGAYIEQAIPKKEHDYEIGWLYDEDIHYHKCKNCEAYKDDAAHNMVETSMVKLASKTSPGIMEYECTTCRYVDYEEVPYVEPPVEEKEDEQVSDKELPPFNAPQTEDIKVVHIYATMAMIGGMTYLLCYFKPIDVSMTEETKKKLVDKLIKWAKSKNRLVKMIALVGISVVLFYYHFMANCRKRNAKVSESADTL